MLINTSKERRGNAKLSLEGEPAKLLIALVSMLGNEDNSKCFELVASYRNEVNF
jgi:hypothetical protein